MTAILLILSFLILFCLTVILFMQQKKFGSAPKGERLQRIKQSPNYKNGKFENIEFTPDLTEGASIPKIMFEFFFKRNPKQKPPTEIPSMKTDLLNLRPDENCFVWFGHSSYFIQTDNIKILVDPVMSGAASPVAFTTRSFPGADVYSPDDLPVIDLLFLTHDHWDHLDHSTLLQLKPKVKKIITCLGVGAHLEAWGFSSHIIIETDWNQHFKLDNGFTIDSTTARHFSGRGFKRGQSLWSSFVLTTPARKIFIGGDSGYGNHFKEIGNKFGPFDLAILECGQYNVFWKYIHAMPEEVILAAEDLKSEKVIPVHWAKFPLSSHDWDDPARRVTKAGETSKVFVMMPMIGQKTDLDKKEVFKNWWENVH